MVLYRLAFPDLLGELVFLIRPDVMDIPLFGRFIKGIGGIGSSCVHKKNGGRTEVIVDHLNSKTKFRFAISPKGTIANTPWKSGYYHITKGTGAKITVVGYDYVNRYIRIFTPQEEDIKLISQEELEEWLKVRMRSLSELQQNPQNVEY